MAAKDSHADAMPAIDAAVVATPTSTHEEVASRLLNAGIDVLVEKPIAATAAAGERWPASPMNAAASSRWAISNASIRQSSHSKSTYGTIVF